MLDSSEDAPEQTAPVFAPVMTTAAVAEVTLGRRAQTNKDASNWYEGY
ncbi:hypothetical protein OG349_07775 [Streptomyces sp. NBC_01317]|nr:hypothetical protein OG349_07775 [Streptomyces sp. NBC_01317]